MDPSTTGPQVLAGKPPQHDRRADSGERGHMHGELRGLR